MINTLFLQSFTIFLVFSTVYPFHRWNITTGKVPVDTDQVAIELHSSVVDALGICLIDNIMFNIFHQKI